MVFRLWVSARQARAAGCTHRGWLFGIVPGFLHPDAGLWISRSHLLTPLEDWLRLVWSLWCWWTGRDEDGLPILGLPIDDGDEARP